MTKALLSLGVAFCVAAAPALQASVVSDFKADLAKKIGNKSGKGAAKAAAKVVSLYVRAKPKGDPKKIIAFTKLANKSLKSLLLTLKDFSVYNKFWSKWVMLNYFRKGKITYSPNDKKFTKALDKVLKFVPPRYRDEKALVQAGFNQLKTNNRKLKGTDQDLGILQDHVAEITGVIPVS